MVEYLTKEGLEKLKKELEYLKKVKRKEIAQRLKEISAFGDRSENFAYSQLKEEQAFLEGRILELAEIIKNAKLIKKKKRNEISLGSIVFLISNGKKLKFQIVGDKEINPQEGKISFQSPLGKALMGKSVGQKIKIETPEGKIEYKILKIE